MDWGKIKEKKQRDVKYRWRGKVEKCVQKESPPLVDFSEVDLFLP
jgi:hypothetical protein